MSRVRVEIQCPKCGRTFALQTLDGKPPANATCWPCWQAEQRQQGESK